MARAMNGTAPDVDTRWLVTGCAGFIGSNLAAYLLERGHMVSGLDNFFSGKRANIDRLEKQYGNRFTFNEGDINDRRALSLALDGCGTIAHLAAQVSVVRSIDMPEETHEVNTTGFMSVIQEASKAGTNRLVYASSCAVYGDNDALPLKEDSELRPMSPYSSSKLANEAYASGFAVVAPELTMTGLRFFNIFGAWQDAAGGYAAVIPKWIGLLMEGREPVLFGDGSATRDFCHVDNVCEAISLAAERDPQSSNPVFNIATGVAKPLGTLYETIVSALRDHGVDVQHREPRKEPPRPGEILHSHGSPDRAEEVLGFRPKIGLDEGLRRTLAQEYGLTPQGR